MSDERWAEPRMHDRGDRVRCAAKDRDLAAMRKTAREVVDALAAFAHAPESDGTFLVMGKDVNRARALLARPEVQRWAGR